MGLDLSWSTRDEAVAAAERDVDEFALIVSRFKRWRPEKLALYVDRAVITPEPERSRRKPHAYARNEVVRIVRLLKLPEKADLGELHRLTDEFAVFMGLQVRQAPRLTVDKRLGALDESIVRPARRLLAGLRNEDIKKELSLAAALPRAYDFDRLSQLLGSMEQHCQAHFRRLRTAKKRGKRWDTELGYQHMFLTELFCEFLRPDFYSSRDSTLEAVAAILAKPIFERLPNP